MSDPSTRTSPARRQTSSAVLDPPASRSDRLGRDASVPPPGAPRRRQIGAPAHRTAPVVQPVLSVEPSRTFRWGIALSVVVGGLVLAGFGWTLRLLENPAGLADSGNPATVRVRRLGPAPRLEVATEWRTDAAGRITRVKAPDAHAVLAAFCREGRDGSERTPVRVVQAGDAWIGVFRQGRDTYGIEILESPEGGFVAGDESGPPVPLPESRLRARGITDDDGR